MQETLLLHFQGHITLALVMVFLHNSYLHFFRYIFGDDMICTQLELFYNVINAQNIKDDKWPKCKCLKFYSKIYFCSVCKHTHHRCALYIKTCIHIHLPPLVGGLKYMIHRRIMLSIIMERLCNRHSYETFSSQAISSCNLPYSVPLCLGCSTLE